MALRAQTAEGPARIARTVVALALLVVTAAACGGGDDPESAATTAASVTGEQSTETATAADTTATESTTAAGTTAAAGVTGDGTLTYGYVLAETGPLASLGPAQISAVKLAVEDVNKAGGVLDKPVTVQGGDEAGDLAIASQTVDRLLSGGADVVVGPIASAISLGVIDKITGAGRVQCSGANTSGTFTAYDDNGFYFRAVPSNVLQAPVFAETAVADGATRVAVLMRSDDYGEGLGEAIQSDLEEQGAEVAKKVSYDPAASNFDVEVGQIVDAKPDAIFIVAFDEGAALLQSLLKRGVNPAETKIYATDGVAYATLAGRVDPKNPASIEGLKGVATSSSNDPAFLERLQASNPNLKVTNFSPYFYDCVITTALAAAAAGSDDPAAIKDEVVNVTREGEKCKTFAACAKLIAAGQDIDYDGVSGPLDYTDVGEPAVGRYDVVQFGADGKSTVVDVITSE